MKSLLLLAIATAFTLVLRRAVAMPNELSAHFRPSLSDPVWLARIHERLVDTPKFYASGQTRNAAFEVF